MLRDHLHAHECPECETRWEHHPDDLQGFGAFERGHTCPTCGYDGPGCRDPLPPGRNHAPSLEEVYRHLGL